MFSEHFNKVYVTLIKRDDEKVVKQFDLFSSVSGHSQQCIFDGFFKTVMQMMGLIRIGNLNIKQLNDSKKTYQNYMNSLLKEVESMKVGMMKVISQTFSHKCKKHDMTKEDPTKLPFTFKMRKGKK